VTQACHDDTCEAEEVLKQIKRFEEGSAGDLKRELLGRHTVRLGHSAQGITGHHSASQSMTARLNGHMAKARNFYSMK
jgi:hypothetical protein